MDPTSPPGAVRSPWAFLSEPLVRLADAIPWKALSGLGLALYTLLRFDYALFYGRFGVVPEEVGFGYAEILSPAAQARGATKSRTSHDTAG